MHFDIGWVVSTGKATKWIPFPVIVCPVVEWKLELISDNIVLMASPSFRIQLMMSSKEGEGGGGVILREIGGRDGIGTRTKWSGVREREKERKRNI